jgi:hypothetical protein
MDDSEVNQCTTLIQGALSMAPRPSVGPWPLFEFLDLLCSR